MKSTNTLNLSFLVKVYVLSVLINIPVCGWQLIHGRDLPFMEAIACFFLAGWTGALLFVPACLLFYLVILLTRGIHREKTYFIVLSASAVIPYFIWMAASNLFGGFEDMQSIAAIASFAAFVAAGAYYEMFMGKKLAEN